LRSTRREKEKVAFVGRKKKSGTTDETGGGVGEKGLTRNRVLAIRRLCLSMS